MSAAAGTVCLQGGGEFSPGCRGMDAALVAGVDGPVVVSALAGAVGREHDTANGNGVRHYREVGATDVSAAPDVRVDREAALAALRRARVLVLPGGSPARLLEALTTTGVDDVVRDLLADGGTVVGSSAGAMVLCGWTVLPERGPTVVRGLGVVPGALVLPHWSGGREDWLRAVRAAVPEDTVLLGVPEESGVVVADGRLRAVGTSGTSLVGRDEVLAVGGEQVVAVSVRVSQEPLPEHDGVLPPWPGEPDGDVFVRRTPWTGGEPALFVHGLGGAATNWTDLMGLLQHRLDGEAVDLPGFGHAPPPADGRYSVSTHARAVVDLLDRRGRGPVHLFGNSLGGAVSTRVAAWRPDLVRTLTLVSPALPNLRPQRGSDPRLPLLLLPGLSTLAARRLAEVSPEARARAVLRLCYGDPGLIRPERLEEAAREVARRNGLAHGQDAFMLSLRGLVGSYLQRGRKGLWAQAATVRAPVLLVWGDRDRLVDVRLAPRAARTFPDSRLLVLPGVGHVAQMETPDVVARAFLGMLDELAERRATR